MGPANIGLVSSMIIISAMPFRPVAGFLIDRFGRRVIDEDHQREKNPSAENAALTTPEEISAALEYLCSEEGGTVNGARIPLYGSP